MSDVAIRIEGLKKQYRLGTIGGGTLSADIESWWARKRGKEDPNIKIGVDQNKIGDRFYALDGIDLCIKKGEAIGIIGSNGAGKSTLLKLISRVTAPTEGTIGINGRITSMLEVGTGFHPELTGRENIYMNGAILGMTKAEIEKKIEDIIEFSEVRQFIDTPVKRYSSGMYVKLAFSVAVHLDSEIMIVDEVLAVGDAMFQKKCIDTMSRYSRNEGKTILYVSHNMSTIRQLCNRCIVLDQGRIVFDGSPEGAIERYLGTVNSQAISCWELENASRPTEDHGNIVRITKFGFEDTEASVFRNSEPIRMYVSWRSNKNVSDLRLRMEILSSDLVPVGMAESEVIGNAVEGECSSAKLTWNASNIVGGDYRIIIDLYVIDEFGIHHSYDHPVENIGFSIIDDLAGGEHTIKWDKNYWNCVRLNMIRKA